MKCQKARELAALAARRELGERPQGELGRHLEGCEACRRATTEGVSLDTALRRSLSSLPPVIDLRPAVMRALPERRAPLPWPLLFRPYLPVTAGFAAATVLVAALGWTAFSQRGAQSLVPDVPPQPAPQLVARLSSVPQSVTLLGADGRERPGAPGGELRVGDRLRTSPEDQAELQTGDGTAVTLDRGTTIRLRPAGVELEDGRLLAEVTPQSQDFIVETPGAEVRVLGTSFTVEKRPTGSTVVTVARGKVRVHNPQGETTVPAGCFTIAREGIAPLPPERIDTEALLEWKSEAGAPPVLPPAELAAEIDATRRSLAAKRDELARLRRALERLRQGAARERDSR